MHVLAAISDKSPPKLCQVTCASQHVSVNLYIREDCQSARVVWVQDSSLPLWDQARVTTL